MEGYRIADSVIALGMRSTAAIWGNAIKLWETFMNMIGRTLLGAAAACLSTLLIAQAQAQNNWPDRPIRLVSPYAPGGASDISLRIIAEHLGTRLNQRMQVENRPGASTNIANNHVAHSAPDGYTVLYAAAPISTVETLFSDLSYSPRKSLKPVAMGILAPLFLVVNAQAEYKTLKDFVAYGKSKADGVNFGHPGVGSQPHLAAELFLRSAGIKGVNIPFRGDAQAYTELLSDRIHGTLTAISTALPLVESGKLRVLGVASAERSSLYPQAQTLREQGFDRVVGSGWYGFMVPEGTPQPIVDRLQTEILAVLNDAEVKKKLSVHGLEVKPGTAADFRKFIDDETAKWSALIREAGIKAN